MNNPPWVPQYVVRNNIPFRRALLHDGKLIEGAGTDELRKNVRKYLQAIDHRPENFIAYFQTAVCRAIPPQCKICRYVDEEAPAVIREPRVLSLTDMIHFLGTMRRLIAGGMQFVSTEKATARANVCHGCPENVEITGCSGCVDLAGRVAVAVGGHKVPGVNDLQGCRSCGCSLKALIFMPLDALGEPTSEPSYCWKRTERLAQEQGEAHKEEPDA